MPADLLELNQGRARYSGPIAVGDVYLWEAEPEPCVVVVTRVSRPDNCEARIFTREAGSIGPETWNNESRFRASVHREQLRSP